MSGDVLDVGVREGHCPECGTKLVAPVIEHHDDDTPYVESGYWCPSCGWDENDVEQGDEQ